MTNTPRKASLEKTKVVYLLVDWEGSTKIFFTRANFDHTVLLNATELNLNEDLTIVSQLGFQARSINTRSFGIDATDQVVRDFFRTSNFLEYLPSDNAKQRTNVLGLYGQVRAWLQRLCLS